MDFSVHVFMNHYSSVEVAAYDEENVDWLSSNGLQQDECTLAFAANEICASLNKVDQIKVVFNKPKEILEACNRIFILSPLTFPIFEKGFIDEEISLSDFPMEDQAFRIISKENGDLQDTFILGHDRIAALYGSYEFLNKIGFEWFSPDAWDEIIPDALPQKLPMLDICSKPSFITRGFWCHGKRSSTEFLLWMARNRLNVWSIYAPQKSLMKKLGIGSIGGDHHFFQKLIPTQRYFKDHPEWYGLKANKRSSDLQIWAGDNPCITNFDLRKTIAENLVEELRVGEYKNASIMSISFLDNGNYCECDECVSYGSPTDHVLLLACECQKAIKKAYEEKRLNRKVITNVNSYVETTVPPTRALPDGLDFDSFMVSFFPIARCYAHDFNDDSCKLSNEILNKNLKKWYEVAPQIQLCIGEYYNISKFVGMSIPFTSRIINDIPYFKSLNAKHMQYMHPNIKDFGTLAQTNHLYAKLTWNANLDGRQVNQDFFALRYAKHHQKVKLAYEILEKAMANCQALKCIPNYKEEDHLFLSLKQKGNADSPVEYIKNSHLTFDNERDDKNVYGPSITESCEGLLEVVVIFEDLIKNKNNSAKEQEILEADLLRIVYTKNIVTIYKLIFQIRFAENDGQVEKISALIQELFVLGETLRKETKMTSNGCEDSEILFSNGLMATYLASIYQDLMREHNIEVAPIPFDGVI